VTYYNPDNPCTRASEGGGVCVCCVADSRLDSHTLSFYMQMAYNNPNNVVHWRV